LVDLCNGDVEYYLREERKFEILIGCGLSFLIPTKIANLWHEAPYSVVESTDVSEDPAASIIRVNDSKNSYTLNMEVTGFSKMSVNV
jgi:hypothetical protein